VNMLNRGEWVYVSMNEWMDNMCICMYVCVKLCKCVKLCDYVGQMWVKSYKCENYEALDYK
jgi:hypothetical protein